MSFLRDLGRDLATCRRPALAFMAIGVFWAAVAAQVPVLKAGIGASDAIYGMVFLVSSFGSVTAMWIAPRVDRRLGRNALAVSAAMMALAFLLPGLAGGLVAFTAAMFLAAMGSGLSDVLMNARVSELEARTGRPLMNLNHAVFSFSYALAAILTGLAREAGWSPALVFSVLTGLILLAVPFMREPRGAVPVPDDIAEAPRGAANAPIVWLGGLVVMIGFLSEAGVEGWSALYLERELGGDPAEGALGPAVLGLTMGVGRLFGQALAVRYPEWLMIAVACLVSAAGLVLAAGAGQLGLAYLGFAAMGLGVSIVAPMALAVVGRSVPQAVRVAAIGRAALIGFMAFSLGPSVMGLTSEAFGLRWSFLGIAVLLVLTALVLAPRLGRQAAAPAN
ncbi:MAG: MFS transporter [Rhodobacteraceae bacterium]|nr:MFS transporter [Paracoccaceae bacterium]